MRRTVSLVALVVVLALITGCSAPKASPEVVVETKVVQVTVEVPVTVVVPAPTLEPLPTYTPYPTYTPPPAPTDTPAPTVAPTSAIGTRKQPVPLGESATMVREDGSTFIGRITEVIWDREQVQAKLVADNMFNDVPAEGYEGMFAYFVAEYTEGDENTPASISDDHFDYLCGDGQFYQQPSVVVADEFAGQGFPGSTFEGWIYWGGAVTDQPDLLVWKPGWLEPTGVGIYLALD